VSEACTIGSCQPRLYDSIAFSELRTQRDTITLQ
jgi:hypothetical protein